MVVGKARAGKARADKAAGTEKPRTEKPRTEEPRTEKPRTRKARSGKADVTQADADALNALGLAPGEKVRFRRRDRARWRVGVAVCVERDGSLRVTDADGAARTIPLSLVQVRASRAAEWEPLPDRASRPLQMRLDL